MTVSSMETKQTKVPSRTSDRISQHVLHRQFVEEYRDELDKTLKTLHLPYSTPHQLQTVGVFAGKFLQNLKAASE